MKSRCIVRKSPWIAVVAALFLTAGAASAQDTWGKAKNGLRVAVFPVRPDRKVKGIRFNVAFQNTGKYDLALNLGVTIPNGSAKRDYPTNVALTLTDSDQSRALALRDTGASLPGAKPLIVRVNAGGNYSMVVNLRDYWYPPNGNYSTRLGPGPYSVQVKFTGQAAAAGQIPVSATSNTSAAYWVGSIKSKKMHFFVGSGYYPGRPWGPYPYGGYPPPYYRPYPPPPPEGPYGNPPPPQPQGPYGNQPPPPPNRGEQQQQAQPNSQQNNQQNGADSQSPYGDDDQAAPQDNGQSQDAPPADDEQPPPDSNQQPPPPSPPPPAQSQPPSK